MNFPEFLDLFNQILNKEKVETPYDDPHFFEYVKLNSSRQNRWLKTGKLLPEIELALSQIREAQNWIVITEPWCGDSAHILPFVIKMAELNPMIHLEIQLRDTSDSEIGNYLTNDKKAIPILISRNERGEDLFIWGPRPKECQKLSIELQGTDKTSDERKIALQNWYNLDKGEAIQTEITALLNSL